MYLCSFPERDPLHKKGRRGILPVFDEQREDKYEYIVCR
jgi:hypothetical protein